MLVGAISGAIGALLIALVGAVANFSTNRASATKLTTESKNVEADTAEVFSRLAAEWTQRADERAERAEARFDKRVGELVEAIDRVAMAVDRVAPILERIADPEELADVVELRAANRSARRLAG